MYGFFNIKKRTELLMACKVFFRKFILALKMNEKRFLAIIKLAVLAATAAVFIYKISSYYAISNNYNKKKKMIKKLLVLLNP